MGYQPRLVDERGRKARPLLFSRLAETELRTVVSSVSVVVRENSDKDSDNPPAFTPHPVA